jgi:hypothetical protein
MQRKLILWWPGRGFGEQLILARATSILIDNNIDVLFYERYKVKDLINCKKIPYLDTPNYKNYKGYEMYKCIYSIEDRDPIIIQQIKHFESLFGQKIEITNDCVPVIYYDMEVPKYDVILHTTTGSWSIYRFWPYFNELEELLDKNHITWIDIDNRKKHGRIGGIHYLNYVKKSKVYVGLETGPSHYVSSIAKNKTLIIQSGFATFDFWAYTYKFDHLEVDVPCRPCFLNKNDIYYGRGCQYNHRCMKEISPQSVFDKIIQIMDKNNG